MPRKVSGENNLSDDDWKKLIDEELDDPPERLKAVTSLSEKGRSFAEPVTMKTENGEEYQVKGAVKNKPQTRRAMITEQIVGSLGKEIGAAIPKVALIDVEELAQAEPALDHFEDNIAHGSRWIPDCNEDKISEIKHTDIGENRERFAILSVLYGWFKSDDKQFLYEKTEPQRIYSHDHGHFLSGGPDWNIQGLENEPAAEPDPSIVRVANITKDELQEAINRLNSIDEKTIAKAVAIPPESWNISMKERIALAKYLQNRKEQLLNLSEKKRKGEKHG